MRRESGVAKLRVWAQEDNALNLELVTELLGREGCQVLTAESAEAALCLATAETPDLILMDLQLPGSTGYEAARHLEANPATAGIPVVALTACAMRGDDGKARETGCQEYLTKPLDALVFRQTLRRSLSGGNAPAGQAAGRGGTKPPEGGSG